MVEFRSNNNVVYRCFYHVVFCPKYRRKVLGPPIDTRLKEVIQETVNDAGQALVEMEVMPEHVHLLLGCDPQYGINRLVRHIKGRSSRILRQDFPWLKSRLPSLWTNSYFVATTGGVTLEVLKRYVQTQKGR